MFPLGSEQSNESLGDSTASCLIIEEKEKKQLELLKRLFISFCHEIQFMSHVGWCHEQTPGANTHVFP